MGGRYFWIHNTGPLGCLPSILVKAKLTAEQFDSVGCGIPYNELAQKFNKMLNETIVQLRRDLPVAAFTYVDVYSVKYLLISQADKYGKILADLSPIGKTDRSLIHAQQNKYS